LKKILTRRLSFFQFVSTINTSKCQQFNESLFLTHLVLINRFVIIIDIHFQLFFKEEFLVTPTRPIEISSLPIPKRTRVWKLNEKDYSLQNLCRIAHLHYKYKTFEAPKMVESFNEALKVLSSATTVICSISHTLRL
jgi:hypothetical protein